MWAGYRSAQVSARVLLVAVGKQKERSQQRSRDGMHSLVALLVAAAAVCAIARPPVPAPKPPAASLLASSPHRKPAPLPHPREYFGEFLYTRFLLPHFSGYEDSPRVPTRELRPNHDWLNKEIDRITQMDEEYDSPTTYEADVPRWIAQDPYLQRILDNARIPEVPIYDSSGIESANIQLRPPEILMTPHNQQSVDDIQHDSKRDQSDLNAKAKAARQDFALTPLDKGYFDTNNKPKYSSMMMEMNGMHEGGASKASMLIEPPRQIRQNPNLSRTKTLVAENLDRLRTGLVSKDYRLPVSLLPTNLRWLKVSNHPDDDESSHEEMHSTDKPRHVHILETTKDPAESMFGVALLSAVGAAITLAIFGFALGWYTLFKKAKAAADVDYPAYGVTGPTVDTSGDRKLAHSAHMYHYQHQKQQIIAMERNGLEQRNGSVSDPESEEENEEGDYTVYECPGFATTGDMEVKNPLFSDDPTPATPGKCEVVKPQPKD